MEPFNTDSIESNWDLPFSTGVRHGDTIYLSGQVPLDPETGGMIEGTVKEQAVQIFENVSVILEEAGSSLDHVIRSTAYLENVDDFWAMNEVYREYFSEPYPARSAFEVSALAEDFDIEIEFIAAPKE